MQSDTRIAQALDALEAPLHAFRSTLANTSEQIRLLISTRLEHTGASVSGARAEFGDFAAGRIDAERMSHLLTQIEPKGIEHGDVVVRALDTCNALLARRESLFRVEVAEGQDLRGAVGRALAEIGTAFGAARVVDLVSKRAYSEDEHASLLDAHPFDHWSRSEREVPLGLVVCVAGHDLRAGGLADFLDRSLKLVLVVQGEAPPAALVRLITPGVFVLQAAEVSELDAFASFGGPAVAALLADSAALFRHDPAGGARLAERLVITSLPDRKPRRLGVTSSFQQRQDLAQLEALAASTALPASAPGEMPASPPAALGDASAAAAPEENYASGERTVERAVGARAEPAADRVDKLSTWLLRQADLSGSP